MAINFSYSKSRLTTRSRYLVYLMKDTITDQKLLKAVKILDQLVFALNFYEKTGEDKYIEELTWASKRLCQLFNKEGGGNE